MSLSLLHVVGSRPNFMKLAPVWRALEGCGNLSQLLVHTGQHYDPLLSEVFFADLALPPPDESLGVGSGSHAEQTARVLLALDPILVRRRPDLVLVYGDVNSTLAATLAAVQRGIRVGHVEAGLRSFDRSMPEEINRMLVDRVASLHFTPSADADENLRREGIASIHQVGNVMIDSLVRMLALSDESGARAQVGLAQGPFALATFHRPANVDEVAALSPILAALSSLSQRLPVVFPVHPRTRARLPAGLASPRLLLVEPLGYRSFIALERGASLVLTDSGGVQEETSFLGVPCLTVRSTTERPVTITLGTNRLVDCDALLTASHAVLDSPAARAAPVIPGWDGHAASRIAAVITALAQ